MPARLLIRILLIAAVCGFCAPLARAADIATQPAGVAPTPEQMADPMFMVIRLRNRIESLNLIGQRKTRVDSILNAAADRAEELKIQIRDLPQPEKVQRVYVFLRDLRQRLATILPNLFGDATTQPAGDGAVAQNLQRLLNALRQLDLSPEQRTKLADLTATLRRRAAEIRQHRQAGQDVSADVQSMQADVRSSLSDILTPDQLGKLRQLMRQPAAPPPTGPPPPPLETPPDANDPFTEQAVPSSAAVPGLRLSEPDLSVVDLSKFKNRVVVLEFGSVSCPTFRDHVQEMEKLYIQYGGRASFFIVYTREAHPSDGWNVQRNEDEQIFVRQPADLIARRDVAARAKAYLHITIPVLVDEMDDRAAKQYNGSPNATVILAAGQVVSRQQWTDPSGLSRLIDLALAVTSN